MRQVEKPSSAALQTESTHIFTSGSSTSAFLQQPWPLEAEQEEPSGTSSFFSTRLTYWLTPTMDWRRWSAISYRLAAVAFTLFWMEPD